jgi:hypothetical protein
MTNDELAELIAALSRTADMVAACLTRSTFCAWRSSPAASRQKVTCNGSASTRRSGAGNSISCDRGCQD